jgi:hypothetical protein
MTEPMAPASIREACSSESVVEAEYLRFSSNTPISFFDGPIAGYRVIRVINGKTTAEEIAIKYDFHDGTACIEPSGWNFSDELMPLPNSKWLLFLKASSDNMYTTYRGDFGRIEIGPKSKEFLEKCEQVWRDGGV